MSISHRTKLLLDVANLTHHATQLDTDNAMDSLCSCITKTRKIKKIRSRMPVPWGTYVHLLARWDASFLVCQKRMPPKLLLSPFFTARLAQVRAATAAQACSASGAQQPSPLQRVGQAAAAACRSYQVRLDLVRSHVLPSRAPRL